MHFFQKIFPLGLQTVSTRNETAKGGTICCARQLSLYLRQHFVSALLVLVLYGQPESLGLCRRTAQPRPLQPHFKQRASQCLLLFSWAHAIKKDKECPRVDKASEIPFILLLLPFPLTISSLDYQFAIGFHLINMASPHQDTAATHPDSTLAVLFS